MAHEDGVRAASRRSQNKVGRPLVSVRMVLLHTTDGNRGAPERIIPCRDAVDAALDRIRNAVSIVVPLLVMMKRSLAACDYQSYNLCARLLGYDDLRVILSGALC
mmetsp:Transcript_1068/g.1958  ORF Transcript_1068/g.1958 Transcript_1068/m.1958 type:complete len:105 (+) Transcript_1068:343-657(+)